MSWLLGCGDPKRACTPDPRTAALGYDTIPEIFGDAPS
jgi:hypothetical protein